MRKRNIFGIRVLALVASMAFTACSEDNTNPNNDEGATEEELELVIKTYVDKAVIPTYADMKVKVTALKTAVDKYVASSTQSDLVAACSAWRAARDPWELSESFLFGPADLQNLDPALDSWPLNKDEIDQILANMDFDKVDGDDNIRGFHTLEYLIFENGQARETAKITGPQKQYMAKVAALLLEDTEALHGAWVNSYGQKFKDHNVPENEIYSAQNAVLFIVEGCMTIADEVGAQKIGNPYDINKTDPGKAVLQVESWYSFNSLTDYKNNVISIENSYMGGCRGNRNEAGSLSTLVKKYDAALDTEIQAAIANAIKAIEKITPPFRNSLDEKSTIEPAMESLANLEESLKKIKRALVL